MASTHETHQTVDPTGDLDYYRNRVHQLEAQIVAVRAIVREPDYRRRCTDAADQLRALLALPDTRAGTWESEHVRALDEPLRDVSPRSKAGTVVAGERLRAAATRLRHRATTRGRVVARLRVIFDADDLYEARGEGELLLDVTDATSPGAVGIVESVEGPAPLAALVRVDRQLDELRQAHARLAERVSDLGDKQIGQDNDLSVEVTALKHRVCRLEDAT